MDLASMVQRAVAAKLLKNETYVLKHGEHSVARRKSTTAWSIPSGLLAFSL
ncbi:hypothetical protein [Chitiniphilus eburneus]|uniref:hypothetical protein n=1 Tax=Chitiniphilus eburneus TaxID=2571148 RepID=UPI0035D01759